jgi:hypothetical protein
MVFNYATKVEATAAAVIVGQAGPFRMKRPHVTSEVQNGKQ